MNGVQHHEFPFGTIPPANVLKNEAADLFLEVGVVADLSG